MAEKKSQAEQLKEKLRKQRRIAEKAQSPKGRR